MREIEVMLRVILGVVSLLVAGVVQSHAGLQSDRVLSGLSIRQTEQHIVVQVTFQSKVMYSGHFSSDGGKVLSVQLQPILVEEGSGRASGGSEFLTAPADNPAGLIRVEYEENDVMRPTLTVYFETNREFEIQQGDDIRSLEILLSLDDWRDGEEASETVDEKNEMSGTQEAPIGSRQRELLARGEAAMAENNYMRAILIYTELIDAADPEIREWALFALANAQERNGHLAHARAEYKKYLQVYPEGKYAVRAQEHLNALMRGASVTIADDYNKRDKVEGGWVHQSFGGISMYYDRDESLGGEGGDYVNVSSLTTGVDVVWRSQKERLAMEVVAVGGYEHSFLEDENHRTRFSRLYIDIEDTEKTITSRLGRQSPNGGGVFTRFDGGHLRHKLMDDLHVNVVAGFPVSRTYQEIESDRYFYGVSLDFGRFAEHWDFQSYYINQLADGIEDRRAIGAEVRFVSSRGSFYSQMDYDLLYEQIGVLLASGSYLLSNDVTRVSILADYRGTPILSTSNAMIGQNTSSLEELKNTLGEDELRRLARDRTLDSSLVTIGIFHPLTSKIQIAGDISWSKIGSAPASGGVEAFETTGDEVYSSLQLIGSDLFNKGETTSVGFRYADSMYRNTYSLVLNSRYRLGQTVQVQPRFRVDYRENVIQDGDQWRIIPGFRIEYTIRENWRVEIDCEYRYANKELEGMADGKDGYYFTVGWRWEF